MTRSSCRSWNITDSPTSPVMTPTSTEYRASRVTPRHDRCGADRTPIWCGDCLAVRTSPGAGAVPGRRGACLAVRTPPAALLDSRLPAARGRRQRIEQVVVAGRGVAGEDHREHVQVEQPGAAFASPGLFA